MCEPNSMRRHAVFLFLLTAIAGCGVDERIREATAKIDRLIAAVDDARIAITKESGKWRDHLLVLEGRLKQDSAELLARDLRDFTDLTIGSTGTELLFVVDVMEEKVRSTLGQIRDALQAERDRIAQTGRIEGTIDGILSKLSVSIVPPQPRICRFTPSDLHLKYTNAFGTPASLEHVTSSGLIKIDGYGFLRPKEEKKTFGLSIIDESGKERHIEDNGTFLIVNTTTAYQLQLNVDKLLTEVKDGDLKVLLTWGGHTIERGDKVPSSPEFKHELPITYGSKPSKPSPPPKQAMITAIQVTVETTNDDKDDGIFFIFLPHLPTHGERGRYQTGTEYWPNGDKRTLNIPLDKPIPFEDRFKYELLIYYRNAKGENTGWEGRLTATGVVVNGDKPQAEILRDTGNFKLGENGNPKERSFPFNQ